MKKYQMHVISGTHWDREWRHTAEQSKLRLVDLIDEIINLLETSGQYDYFLVDGGSIVLEDYLTIRPEKEEQIRKLIKTGKMQIVCWYTLPETFTVAPEALIRNLLTGTRMAKRFGGAIKSGYTATSYGQTSQLPQIYRGFGIETAIFYRGTNRYIYPPLFKWEGLDGSQLYTLKTFDDVTRTNWFFYVHQPMVLGKSLRDLTYTYDKEDIPVHLCDEGLYERAFKLRKEEPGFGRDERTLKLALDAITQQAMPYAVGGHLLALNMEDNMGPFPLLPEMIEELNKVSPDIEIIQDSLDRYMEAIISESRQAEMPTHHGELRYTMVDRDSFNCLLGATHSSRVKLKLLNEKVETNLIFLAEPIAAIASILGVEYPQTCLNRAWEALLKNHAHDSICGAAVDQAHEDMLYGFSISNTVAEEVAARGVISLFDKIDTKQGFQDGDQTITLFNTLPMPRREIVPLIIDFPQIAKTKTTDIGVGGVNTQTEFFDVVDEQGIKVDHTVVSDEIINMGVERELDAKSIRFPVRRKRILLDVTVPEMGYSTYAIRFRGPALIEFPENGPERLLIARENGVLENEHLRISINPNGTFSLYQKATGRTTNNLHYFTDYGEVGSAHLSKKPQRNQVYTSLGGPARITMVESNLLRGSFRIDLALTVPAGATLDERDRLREMVELPITYWLTLEKGGKFLKIKTRLSNKARDHKLCVNFPTGIDTDYAIAESAFAVEKRCVRHTVTGDNFESFYPFQPMQNFIDVNDGTVGLAVLTRGLREYEVMDDKDRTVAITLLRTHRAYMTANPDMTPEEFDRYTGLHCLGDLEYCYALYPHKGGWDDGDVLQASYQYKVEIKAIQGVPKAGDLPSSGSFFTIHPAGKAMLSALKRSEDGQGIILRLWNSTSDAQNVEIDTPLPIGAVKRVNLDETPLSDLDIAEGKIRFTIGPHKIETLFLA